MFSGLVKGTFLYCFGLLRPSLAIIYVSAIPQAGREANPYTVIIKVPLYHDLFYRIKPRLSPQEPGCKPLCIWDRSFRAYY